MRCTFLVDTTDFLAAERAHADRTKGMFLDPIRLLDPTRLYDPSRLCRLFDTTTCHEVNFFFVTANWRSDPLRFHDPH